MVNQMLTGHTPFWGLTDRDVRRAILSAPLSFEKQVAAAAAATAELEPSSAAAAAANSPRLSDEAKAFVASLLNRSVGERPSAAEALDHPWLVAARQQATAAAAAPWQTESSELESSLGSGAGGMLTSLTESGQPSLPLSIWHSMAAFKNFSAIRKTALEVLAHRLEPAQILELRELFKLLDTSNSGVLSFAEFAAVRRPLSHARD